MKKQLTVEELDDVQRTKTDSVVQTTTQVEVSGGEPVGVEVSTGEPVRTMDKKHKRKIDQWNILTIKF